MSEQLPSFKNLQISSDLFKNVKCFITGSLDVQVIKLLEDGGASISKFMVDFVTHVICGSNFDETIVAEATDLYEKPPVTENWVTSSVKLGKLASTKAYYPVKNKIFSNLRFSVSQISAKGCKELYKVVTFYGGEFSSILDNRTTHLICGTAKGAAYSKGVSVKKLAIITPDWISDCISKQNLIPTNIYHPSLIIEPKLFKAAPPNQNRINPADANKPLSSILGFDFEENIAKTELAKKEQDEKDKNNVTPVNVNQSPQRMTIVRNLTPPQLQQQQLINQKIRPNLQQQQIQLTPQQQQLQKQQQMQQQQQQQLMQPQQQMQGQGGHQVPQTNIQQMQNITHNLQQQQTAAQMQQKMQQQMLQQQQQQSMQQQNAPQSNPQLTPQQQIQQQLQQIQQNRINLNVSQQPNTNVNTVTLQSQGNQPQNVQQQQQQIIQHQNIIGGNKQNIVVFKTTSLNNSNNPNQQQQQPQQQQQQQHVQQIISSMGNTEMSQQQPLQQQQQLPPQQQQVVRQITINQGQQHNQQQGNSQTIHISPHQQQQLIQHMQNLQHQRNNVAATNAGQPQSQPQLGTPQQQQQQGQPKVIHQQTIIHQQQYQTITKQVIVGQQPQQQSQQQQQQQQQSSGPSQIVQKIVQHQVIPGNGNQQQNIVIINQQNNQQQILASSSGGTVQNINLNQQRLQQLQLQQKQNLLNQQGQQQQQLPHQQVVVSGNQMQQQRPQGAQQIVVQQQQQPPQQLLPHQIGTQNTSGGTVQQILQQNIPQQQQQQQQQQHVMQQSQQQNVNIIQQQQPNPAQQQQTSQQSWTPQSPLQQQQQQQSPIQLQQQQQQQMQSGGIYPGGTTIVQQNIPQQVQGQPGTQFIRGPRPQYQRQLIHLNDETYAALQKLDPAKRQEYIDQLQRKVAFQARPGVQQGVVTTVPRPGTHHIVHIRGAQMPPGLTHQQQLQWIQQQGARSVVVRPTAPGLSPISQQVVANPQQAPNNIPMENMVSFQQQQRILQNQRLLQMQSQRDQVQKSAQQQGQAVSPRGPGFPTETIVDPNAASQSVIIQDPNNQAQPNKTKLAIANMLSNRLGNNGNVVASITDTTAEPSAAGTLRLMTAQHNAALQQTPRTPQELIALQQQQQQRRTLGNITNSAPATPVVNQMPQVPQVGVLPQSPSNIKGPPFSPGRATLPRPQFYGHNPNLKLPADLFLLGCTFFIVEYDETHKNEIGDWIQIIQKHGGEIETTYTPRVTHVLCRTQRHGVVMQALRDTKRCVTSYWLSDIILKKQLLPPWQALHLPSPSIFGSQKPATQHIMCITSFEGEERTRIKQMIEESGAKLTTYFTKSNTVLICKRIDNVKYKYAKEWNIPAVNVSWLSDILLGNSSVLSQFHLPKYQQYQYTSAFRIDYQLVAHLMAAWKSPINLTQESHERVKRSLSDPAPVMNNKKMRTLPPLEIIPDEIICNKLPEQDNIPIIMFSQIDNIEGLQRAVTILGGKITNVPQEATHLVMTRVARTTNLMISICVVKYAITTKWVVDSVGAGYLLPPDNYRLNVEELEEIFKCDFYRIIESPARNKLFEGKIFFITPLVKPAYKHVKMMIELSGGIVEKNARSVRRIRETNFEKPESYVIISCVEDKIFLQTFMQRDKQNICQVCTTEYVMQAILKQQIITEPHIIRWE